MRTSNTLFFFLSSFKMCQFFLKLTGCIFIRSHALSQVLRFEVVINGALKSCRKEYIYECAWMEQQSSKYKELLWISDELLSWIRISKWIGWMQWIQYPYWWKESFILKRRWMLPQSFNMWETLDFLLVLGFQVEGMLLKIWWIQHLWWWQMLKCLFIYFSHFHQINK